MPKLFTRIQIYHDANYVKSRLMPFTYDNDIHNNSLDIDLIIESFSNIIQNFPDTIYYIILGPSKHYIYSSTSSDSPPPSISYNIIRNNYKDLGLVNSHSIYIYSSNYINNLPGLISIINYNKLLFNKYIIMFMSHINDYSSDSLYRDNYIMLLDSLNSRKQKIKRKRIRNFKLKSAKPFKYISPKLKISNNLTNVNEDTVTTYDTNNDQQPQQIEVDTNIDDIPNSSSISDLDNINQIEEEIKVEKVNYVEIDNNDRSKIVESRKNDDEVVNKQNGDEAESSEQQVLTYNQVQPGLSSTASHHILSNTITINNSIIKKHSNVSIPIISRSKPNTKIFSKSNL